MAIKAKDAIAAARGLIGTPYSELDCINLIKKVVRTAPGGDKSYTTAGSNSLWDSFWSSGKYKHITEQITGIAGAKAGMLAFKAQGEDYHHVGIVTENGTVVHSSSTQGGRGVVETPLTSKEGWTHLAVHRLIETSESGDKPQEEGMAALYNARVVTKEGPLNVRQVPEVGKVIGKIPKGEVVGVYSSGNWVRAKYGEIYGYVSAEYLERIEEEAQETTQDATQTTTLINEETGAVHMLVGKWRTAED